MKGNEKYCGIFPALITPFDREGNVNEEALRKVVELNLGKGVQGFYVDGSTAESFLLSHDERKRILDVVANAARGKATLIAHVGAIGTEQAVDLAKHAKAARYDAISAVPPFYYKFSFEEIKFHYERILESVDMPMLIYNYPANSGVTISSDQVREFRKDRRFIGVKFTSYDLFQLQQIKSIDDDIVVFNGHDEVLLGGLAMGATGAIGSTYNFMAEKFLAIESLFRQSKIKEAQAIQFKANKIIAAMIKVGVMQGEKYALELQGIDCGGCRRPFRPLTDEEKRFLRKSLEENA